MELGSGDTEADAGGWVAQVERDADRTTCTFRGDDFFDWVTFAEETVAAKAIVAGAVSVAETACEWVHSATKATAAGVRSWVTEGTSWAAKWVCLAASLPLIWFLALTRNLVTGVSSWADARVDLAVWWVTTEAVEAELTLCAVGSADAFQAAVVDAIWGVAHAGSRLVRLAGRLAREALTAGVAGFTGCHVAVAVLSTLSAEALDWVPNWAEHVAFALRWVFARAVADFAATVLHVADFVCSAAIHGAWVHTGESDVFADLVARAGDLVACRCGCALTGLTVAVSAWSAVTGGAAAVAFHADLTGSAAVVVTAARLAGAVSGAVFRRVAVVVRAAAFNASVVAADLTRWAVEVFGASSIGLHALAGEAANLVVTAVIIGVARLVAALSTYAAAAFIGALSVGRALRC